MSHQPIQHLIIKRSETLEKESKQKRKNVNSITSWLPGASYLISLCLPGCTFLRRKGCLNKCFVGHLSQHQAWVQTRWQICHGATFQLMYVRLCNITLGLIHQMICVLQQQKKKIKMFAFHCHLSRTKSEKLVSNLTSKWAVTWVFNCSLSLSLCWDLLLLCWISTGWLDCMNLAWTVFI